MKSNNPDIIFQCRKCQHLLYIDIKNFIDKEIYDDMKACDNCGEDPEGNWILYGSSNYDKDYPE